MSEICTPLIRVGDKYADLYLITPNHSIGDILRHAIMELGGGPECRDELKVIIDTMDD